MVSVSRLARQAIESLNVGGMRRDLRNRRLRVKVAKGSLASKVKVNGEVNTLNVSSRKVDSVFLTGHSQPQCCEFLAFQWTVGAEVTVEPTE